jgi:hypothetical protein
MHLSNLRDYYEIALIFSLTRSHLTPLSGNRRQSATFWRRGGFGVRGEKWRGVLSCLAAVVKGKWEEKAE